MSGLEVIGAIAAVLGIVGSIEKTWNDAQKAIKFNNEFEAVASKIFILQSILKTCESDFQKIQTLPKDDDARLATVMRSCGDKFTKLETIFKETTSGGKDKWYEKYRDIWKKFGSGSRVEELTLSVVEDTKIIAVYHQVKTLSPESGQKLDELAKELQSLQPSVTEDSSSTYTFNNEGEGQQYVHTGWGPQMNDNSRIYGYQSTGESHYYLGRPEPSLPDFFKFDGQHLRENQLDLSRADPNSFEWLWHSPFKKWVDSPNDKVFWITGKPGSGKSMCMKYISKRQFHHRPSLLRIHFFFNYAADSTSILHTINGLRRSILQQICEDVRGLRPAIMKEFDLKGSLQEERILSGEMLSDITRFAFDELHRLRKPVFLLLDGLDDYKGDLCEVSEVVQEFESKPAVLKLCVASRPHEFGTQFSGWPKLYLESYNKLAIFGHAMRKLLKHCPPAHREQEQANISRLSEQLATKANGVFLWADLAIRELCNLLRRKADIEQHEELLRSLPAELTKYYERLIVDLRSHRGAWGIVFKLIASVKTEMWISLLYEACHYLNLPILWHNGPVTQKKLQKFSDCIYYQTGGLLTLSQKNGPWESDRGETDFKWLEVSFVHRSLRNYLDSDGVWKRLFTSNDDDRNIAAVWVDVAEPVLSQPLQYAIETPKRTGPGALSSTFYRPPHSEPQFGLQLSTINGRSSLRRYIEKYLPSHLFDYETEMGTPVPLHLVQYLERSGYAIEHTQASCACLCEERLYWDHPKQPKTVPEILIIHTCELTIAQYMQRGLSTVQGPISAFPRAAKKHTLLPQEQCFLEAAILQSSLNLDRDGVTSRSRSKAQSLLRSITSKCTEIESYLLAEAVQRLPTESLHIVLTNCTQPGPLLLSRGLTPFPRRLFYLEFERSCVFNTPLFFWSKRRFCNAESKKVLELLLARGEDVKQQCSEYGTVVHAVLLQKSGCYECGTKNKYRSLSADPYEPYSSNPIQQLDLLACYGASIELMGPNNELCRFFEEWKECGHCKNPSFGTHMCSIKFLPQYLYNPAAFMRDHPDIRKEIQSGRKEIGYRAMSRAWNLVGD